jgi:hypothetical protein
VKTLFAFMMFAGIVAAPFGGEAAAPTRYYWYHPVGSACPHFPYDPGIAHSPNKAKAECETKTGRSCSSAEGTAEPAC